MSQRANLSVLEARDLPHGDLIERIDGILASYDVPMGVETQVERIERLSRTIDEMPELYRWFSQLWSWCDHWTDANMDMFGGKDHRYKKMRERRDLFEKIASSAKLRYEGASRAITLMEAFDPSGMPRTRRSMNE